MLATINQAFQSYYDELPQSIFPIIAKSACFSFTICLLLSAGKNEALDISRPLLKGGVAAVASTIHALATPLFDRIFGKGNLNAINETVKSTVVAFIASILMIGILESSIQFTAFKMYYLISGNSFTAWTTSGHNVPHIPHNSVYLCF